MAGEDGPYRGLLLKELRYCNGRQAKIARLAESTYSRVIEGRDGQLLKNSCAFRLLERACRGYAPTV